MDEPNLVAAKNWSTGNCNHGRRDISIRFCSIRISGGSPTLDRIVVPALGASKWKNGCVAWILLWLRGIYGWSVLDIHQFAQLRQHANAVGNIGSCCIRLDDGFVPGYLRAHSELVLSFATDTTNAICNAVIMGIVGMAARSAFRRISVDVSWL